MKKLPERNFSRDPNSMDYGLAVERDFGQCSKPAFAAGIFYCVFLSGRKSRSQTLSEAGFCGRSLSVETGFEQCLKSGFMDDENSWHFIIGFVRPQKPASDTV